MYYWWIIKSGIPKSTKYIVTYTYLFLYGYFQMEYLIQVLSSWQTTLFADNLKSLTVALMHPESIMLLKFTYIYIHATCIIHLF